MEAWREELYHHGITGMHWGVRRWQNPDGSLTPEGRKRYLKNRKRFDEWGNFIGEGKITDEEYRAMMADEADRIAGVGNKDRQSVKDTSWLLDKDEFRNYLYEVGIKPENYSQSELSKMQQIAYKSFVSTASKKDKGKASDPSDGNDSNVSNNETVKKSSGTSIKENQSIKKTGKARNEYEVKVDKFIDDFISYAKNEKSTGKQYGVKPSALLQKDVFESTLVQAGIDPRNLSDSQFKELQQYAYKEARDKAKREGVQQMTEYTSNKNTTTRISRK